MPIFPRQDGLRAKAAVEIFCHPISDTEICERFSRDWVQWSNANAGVWWTEPIASIVLEHGWIALAKAPNELAVYAGNGLRRYHRRPRIRRLSHRLRANVSLILSFPDRTWNMVRQFLDRLHVLGDEHCRLGRFRCCGGRAHCGVMEYRHGSWIVHCLYQPAFKAAHTLERTRSARARSHGRAQTRNGRARTPGSRDR